MFGVVGVEVLVTVVTGRWAATRVEARRVVVRMAVVVEVVAGGVVAVRAIGVVVVAGVAAVVVDGRVVVISTIVGGVVVVDVTGVVVLWSCGSGRCSMRSGAVLVVEVVGVAGAVVVSKMELTAEVAVTIGLGATAVTVVMAGEAGATVEAGVEATGAAWEVVGVGVA